MDKLEEIEQKLDEIREIIPTIQALGELLVRADTATSRVGLHKNTIYANKKMEKYDEVGHRRTFIEVGELSVVKRRGRRKV